MFCFKSDRDMGVDNATWILPPSLVQIGAAALMIPGKRGRRPRINITMRGISLRYDL